MSKPAPDETDVGWRNPEGMFQKQRPKIKREGCAKPDEDRFTEIIHASRFSAYDKPRAKSKATPLTNAEIVQC